MVLKSSEQDRSMKWVWFNLKPIVSWSWMIWKRGWLNKNMWKWKKNTVVAENWNYFHVLLRYHVKWCHYQQIPVSPIANPANPVPLLSQQNTPTASLQRSKTPNPNECPRYGTKQSDGAIPVILEFGGIQSTTSLPLLPSPLWLGVLAPDKILSKG